MIWPEDVEGGAEESGGAEEFEGVEGERRERREAAEDADQKEGATGVAQLDAVGSAKPTIRPNTAQPMMLTVKVP